MIYVKKRKEDVEDSIKTKNNVIIVEIYEDEFYSTCSLCKKERNIDFDELKQVLNTDGDFSSTSLFCSECSEKYNAR